MVGKRSDLTHIQLKAESVRGSRGENRALGRTERPRCWPVVSLSGAEILQAKLQVVHTGVPLHDSFFFFNGILGAGNGDTQLAANPALRKPRQRD